MSATKGLKNLETKKRAAKQKAQKCEANEM